jgi:hypothetical protein
LYFVAAARWRWQDGAMLHAILLMMAAANPPPFAWVTYIRGESIIHGIAETDSRDLRIDCTTGGRLDVIVWSDVAAASGATVPVVVEGDMPQLVARVAADHPFIRALLRGQSVSVNNNPPVPGTGAPLHLKPLIAACK